MSQFSRESFVSNVRLLILPCLTVMGILFYSGAKIHIIIRFLSHRKSGLAFGEVEGSDGGFLLTRNADGAKLLLVAHDILLKGSQ